jgi:two-component system phosphate regulon response regulator OmpR
MLKGARYSILSVDADLRARQSLAKYLHEQGFNVRQAGSGKDALRFLELHKIDLVLVDVMLGRENGVDFARDIRFHWPHIGIIVITARDDPVDRVLSLENGADDYITKPFNPREVLARINSLLRRTAAIPKSSGDEQSQSVLQFEGWSLDLGQRQLRTARGGEVALTTGEFNLLAALASRPGHVLAREYLLELINDGRHNHPFDRTIDARISRLRKKIEIDPQHPKIIKAVRGIGYVLTARKVRS